MSARSVCSGTRPRGRTPELISAPPRRPEHCTRMPLTLAGALADWMALRIAPAERHAVAQLLGDTLCHQLRLTPSGLLTSRMFSWTRLPVSFSTSA